MDVIEGYDHQPGVHCGAAALRNVAQYYGWNYSEAACFGYGGGAAFVLYEHPDEPWVTFRASPTWLERAALERLGVPHAYNEGEDAEAALSNVTAHVDEDDPVLVFLDPSALPYLPEDPTHLPAHVAVVVGYDDEMVTLSDAAMDSRQTVSRERLAAAWRSDGFVPLDNEYLVVTRARRTEDETDAAAAGLRQAATYMLEPLQIERDARGPGEEGLPAMRSFGEYVSRWPDLAEPFRPVRAASRAVDEHGDGAAYRGLFAAALEELGQRTGLAHDVADRMAGVADDWRTVGDLLGDVLAADEPHPAQFEEAASRIGELADCEAAIHEDLTEELGRIDGRGR